MAYAQTINIDWEDDGLSDDDFLASADIAGDKLICRRSADEELFGPATTVTALTKWLHIAKSAGTSIGFEAAIAVLPTGDRDIDVDIQKSTGGGAFATIVSATLNFSSGSTVRVPSQADINSSAIADGDIFQVVVTLGGSTGNYPQGLTVTFTYDEEP